MGLFGNSQGKRLADLEAQVASLAKRCASAEATAADCAERAYRFMKKAEARSRRELDANPNQDQDPVHGAAVPGNSGSSGSRRLWGARARRAAARRFGDPLLELNGEGTTNGVHS